MSDKTYLGFIPQGIVVKIGDVYYSSDTEPIAIIFRDDQHRLRVAEQINDMPAREGQRMYAQFPTDKYTVEEYDAFMKFENEQ